MSTEQIAAERPPNRRQPGAAGGLVWSTEVAAGALVFGALLVLLGLRAGFAGVLSRIGD